MKTTILFLLSAICAVAQTNIVTTNQPVTLTTKTNKPANLQPKIVTKEMVLAGLKTLDGEDKKIATNEAAIASQLETSNKRLLLQYQAGEISANDYSKRRFDILDFAKTPEYKAMEYRRAQIRLQQFDIRQRYAQLLKLE
jgi:hypothetical protein